MTLPTHTSPHLDRWTLDAVYPPDHSIPVLTTTDVVVVGAGAAGTAAATVLAEEGLSVVLVERYGFAGGAAVAGMSGTICGLYLATDDERSGPHQVVFGFAERFRAELESRGGVTAPQRYGKTWTVAHDPAVWRDSADTFFTAAGVRVLYHTAVVGVVMEGDAYRGVILESNAGRVAVHCQRVIDASGDGAVVSRGGAGYFFGDNGRIQNPTMFFRLANVDTDAFWDYFGPDTICHGELSAAIIAERERGADLPREKIWVFRTPRPGELMVNATRLTGPLGRVLNVIDPEDFTIAEIDGRRQVRAYAHFFREQVPGCGAAYVVDTGVEVGIRQTRSIAAVRPLTNDMVVSCEKSGDGIARSPWPIELHDGTRPKLHWLLDDYYEVPYGALVPTMGENIIVAGRCLGAEHEALASARVTAQCFEYGHAAARATVMSLQTSTAYRDVDVDQLRRTMIEHGSAL